MLKNKKLVWYLSGAMLPKDTKDRELLLSRCYNENIGILLPSRAALTSTHAHLKDRIVQ